jgi:uncharacterized membrane protein YcaP (DUF421 family)
MFSLDLPVLEVAVRASVVYLALCVLMRLIPKRNAGGLSPNDMVVLVTIGGVAAATLVRESMSVPGVLVVIATILFWSYALNWLGQRFPRLHPLLQEPPTKLIEQGHIIEGNLRKELVTEEDIRAQLRKQGIDDVAGIREARLETDGSISVVADEERRPGAEPTHGPATR